MSDPESNDERITSHQCDYDTLRYVSEETPCPYLPGLKSRCEAYAVDTLDGAMYERLLARGFRRSGRTVYRPRCRSCSECRSVRVPVSRFVPSRSQRRVQRRNEDVRVEIVQPEATDKKFALFCRYLDFQHDNTMTRTEEAFQDFLFDSPMQTCEFDYFLGDRLVGVSLADRWSRGLSSVYMFFEPDVARRSLGTFSVLYEIEFCRRERLPFYYLGYYVAQSETMAYKSDFRPNEILVAENRWLGFRE